jgi:hypothetical protein
MLLQVLKALRAQEPIPPKKRWGFGVGLGNRKPYTATAAAPKPPAPASAAEGTAARVAPDEVVLVIGVQRFERPQDTLQALPFSHPPTIIIIVIIITFYSPLGATQAIRLTMCAVN